jgi:hypothetical protein
MRNDQSFVALKHMLYFVAWCLMLLFWFSVWEPLVMPYLAFTIWGLGLRVWGE